MRDAGEFGRQFPPALADAGLERNGRELRRSCQVGGPTAAYAALSIGLFNSIMFPTIFTLTLERSSAPTSATSGLLVFGIIGGAFLPPVAGHIADLSGHVAPGFVVPLVGYVLLTLFAIACIRKSARADGAPAAVTLH